MNKLKVSTRRAAVFKVESSLARIFVLVYLFTEKKNLMQKRTVLSIYMRVHQKTAEMLVMQSPFNFLFYFILFYFISFHFISLFF